MAKRFTDTDKWKKDFIRTLPSEYKLFWIYITDECNNAGIWEVEVEVAELRLGIKLSTEKAWGFFKKKMVKLDNGTKWFIPDFINFQYGQLSINNKAHLPVISALQKFSLLTDDLKLKNKIKEPPSPLQGAKEMEKEKEMEMEMEMEMEIVSPLQEGFEEGFGENFLIPKMCSAWYKTIQTYTKDKQNDFEGMGKILKFMSRQPGNFSIDDHEKILNTIKLISDEVLKDNFWVNKPIKSIANNIQEFYNKIKNPFNGKHNKRGCNGFSREGIQRELDKRRNAGQ